MKHPLDALISAICAPSGSILSVDQQIATEFGWVRGRHRGSVYWKPPYGYALDLTRQALPPAFTTDVNAAAALCDMTLKGWHWQISMRPQLVEIRAAPSFAGLSEPGVVTVSAGSLARAFCLVAVTARRQIQPAEPMPAPDMPADIAANSAKKWGWVDHLAGRPRDRPPFTHHRLDLIADYQAGWDAAQAAAMEQ